MIFWWPWTHIGLGHSLLGIYLQHFPSLLFCFHTKEADLGFLFCQLCIVVACLMCLVSVHACVCEILLCWSFGGSMFLCCLLSLSFDELCTWGTDVILHSTLLKNCCARVKFAYIGMFLSFLSYFFVLLLCECCVICIGWCGCTHVRVCVCVYVCVCVCVCTCVCVCVCSTILPHIVCVFFSFWKWFWTRHW